MVYNVIVVNSIPNKVLHQINITNLTMKNTDKKNAKKQLELSITEKFMAALSELGHDAEKLKREVKKASKFVTKKIGRKFKDIKHVIEEKLDSAPVKATAIKAEKTASAAKKDIGKQAVKVEKVIAKATKVAQKRISKPVAQAAGKIESVAADATKTVKKVAAKSVVKIDSAIADTKAAAAAPVKKATGKTTAAPKPKPAAGAAPAAKTAAKATKK